MSTQNFYDRLEGRAPAARETALMRDLGHVLSVSKNRVPALRAQLKGVDVGQLRTRADLRRIPLRRHADLLAAQAEEPPFGGFAATRLAGLQGVFLGPTGLCAMSGHAKDWWGFARALQAAGLRKGALVLNAFPYDLEPFGHMVDAGARAIGCPVIPAGNADLGAVSKLAERLAPRFFCGMADRLKRFLDVCAGDGGEPTIERALVSGVINPGLRSELELRAVAVRQVFATSEFGAVAFETGQAEGMTLVENLLLEVVDPGTGLPVGPGGEGEMVLSRVNLDYPLLRFATGYLTRVLDEPSPCGRTNTRIAVPRLPSDPATEPLTVAEIRRRHPEYIMRLYAMRASGTFHLKVEHAGDETALRERLGRTLLDITHQPGTVEIVRPGTLDDDESAAGSAPP